MNEDAFLGASLLEKELADIRREKSLLNKESAEYIACEKAEKEVVA
jgi:hypothetical protein